MANTEGKGLVFRKEPFEGSIQGFKKLNSIHAGKYAIPESSLWHWPLCMVTTDRTQTFSLTLPLSSFPVMFTE